jgi:hypothetical protein
MASTIAGTGLPSAWAEIAVAAQAEVGVPLPSPASLARHVFPDCPQAELGRATDIVADILAQRLPIWRRFGAIPPSAWR